MFFRALFLITLFTLFSSFTLESAAAPVVEKRICRYGCKFTDNDATSSVDFAASNTLSDLSFIRPTEPVTVTVTQTVLASSLPAEPTTLTVLPTASSAPVVPSANSAFLPVSSSSAAAAVSSSSAAVSSSSVVSSSTSSSAESTSPSASSTKSVAQVLPYQYNTNSALSASTLHTPALALSAIVGFVLLAL